MADTINIAEVTEVLAKGKGCKFANIKYRNAEGELSMYRVMLGTDTRKLYEKDVDTLAATMNTLTGTMALAAQEIMSSLLKSIANMVNGTPNPDYVLSEVRLDCDGLPGIWIHKETGVMYVQCVVLDKTVIEAVEYKKVNSSEKTLCKKQIEKGLRKSKIRTMTIKKISRIAANGEVIEIDAD